MKKILAPTDLSEASVPAIELALALAGQMKQIPPHLFLRKFIGTEPVEFGQLINLMDVSFLGPLG